MFHENCHLTIDELSKTESRIGKLNTDNATTSNKEKINNLKMIYYDDYNTENIENMNEVNKNISYSNNTSDLDKNNSKYFIKNSH